MKYLRLRGCDRWHECSQEEWSGFQVACYCSTVGRGFVTLDRIAELVDEHHLPDDAKLCKHCFPDGRTNDPNEKAKGSY
jgi:hypothetical protein